MPKCTADVLYAGIGDSTKIASVDASAARRIPPSRCAWRPSRFPRRWHPRGGPAPARTWKAGMSDGSAGRSSARVSFAIMRASRVSSFPRHSLARSRGRSVGSNQRLVREAFPVDRILRSHVVASGTLLHVAIEMIRRQFVEGRLVGALQQAPDFLEVGKRGLGATWRGVAGSRPSGTLKAKCKRDGMATTAKERRAPCPGSETPPTRIGRAQARGAGKGDIRRAVGAPSAKVPLGAGISVTLQKTHRAPQGRHRRFWIAPKTGRASRIRGISPRRHLNNPG